MAQGMLLLMKEGLCVTVGVSACLLSFLSAWSQSQFRQTAAVLGHGGEFVEPFPNPLGAGFFVSGQSTEAISPSREASCGTCANFLAR